MAKDAAARVVAKLGLTVKAEFVPFSKSRNAKPDSSFGKGPCLNWRVTLEHAGRSILTTDYSAGYGHCPASKLSVKEAGNQNSIMRMEMIKQECETGRTHRSPNKPIMPDTLDFIYSLAIDSDVIDFARFEDWASEFGYDPDSRKAESTYRNCLEIALRLRAGIGDANLTRLREAFQDY